MKNKQLGIFALIGAPFLCIDMLAGKYFSFLPGHVFTGVNGLLYISGWLASMEILRRIHDTGTRDFSWFIIRTTMFTLLIADISNVWQIVSATQSTLFFAFDMGWPVSNVLMLLVGLAVIKRNVISGWQRWIPIAVGCWFPICTLMGRTDIAFYVGAAYSAMAWSLFAISMLQNGQDKKDILPVRAARSH